jgi:hypothetical protein
VLFLVENFNSLFIKGNLLIFTRYIRCNYIVKPLLMKTIFSLLTLLFVVNTVSFSQELSQEDKMLSESILIQKSYHIDLPAYDRAVVIVRRLISETELSKQEIISMLDDMVSSPATITRQFLELFHGLPAYIGTGDSVVDQENYIALKTAWIENNPDKYQELIDSNKPSK